MSAPIAPGGCTRPSDTTSVTTTISSAPAAWAASAIGVEIADLAEDVGVLHHDAGDSRIDLIQEIFRRAMRQRRHDLIARHARYRLDGLAIVRMQVARENCLAPLGDPVRHQHSFRRRCRAVVHGGVGHLHGRQHRHLRLELEQVLQRALRDLGLVGRVGGQEFRALDQVIHRRRHVMLVGAGADEERHRSGRHVLVRHPAQRCAPLPARPWPWAGR